MSYELITDEKRSGCVGRIVKFMGVAFTLLIVFVAGYVVGQEKSPATSSVALRPASTYTPTPIVAAQATHAPSHDNVESFLIEVNALTESYSVAFSGIANSAKRISGNNNLLYDPAWQREMIGYVNDIRANNAKARTMTAPAIYQPAWELFLQAGDHYDAAMDALEKGVRRQDLLSLQLAREEILLANSLLDQAKTLMLRY